MSFPNVDFSAFDPAERIDKDRLWQHVRPFSTSVRTSGSPAEHAAFTYARDILLACGYETRLLHHPAYISVPGTGTIALDDDVIACGPNAMSAPVAGLTAPLVAIHEDSIEGKITVCEGLATPGSVKKLVEGGAAGAIFINSDQRYEMIVSPVWGSPDDRSLEWLPQIPVVSVPGKEREWLLAAARKHKSVTVNSSLDTGWRDIPLLEADLPVPESDGSLVLFSGHIDAWHLGAMDNGGANATMLEVARVLSDVRTRLRRSIRFLFWSGHSHGRYAGSQWYADQHFEELYDRALIHINIDSVGAKGADILSEAPSMAELRHLARTCINSETPTHYAGARMERAGDQSFFGHGVSSIFMGLSEQPKEKADTAADGFASLFGGGRTGGFGWWWHTPEDTIDKLDPDNLARDARIYCRLAYTCCASEQPPLRYSETAAELVSQLTRYQEAAGSLFDLTETINRAEQLTTSLKFLERQLTDQPDSVDWRTFKALGRILIPLNYVAGPSHEHDPALNQPAIPRLAAISSLNSSNDNGHLKHRLVRLTRERNIINLQLRKALELCTEKLTDNREKKLS